MSTLTITNEDNMELMARYPDNYFDLAIVDPPYGINASLGGNGSRVKKYDRTKKKIGITKHQKMNIGKNYLGFQKVKLFSE